MRALTGSTDDGNATSERGSAEEELEALVANFGESGLNETSAGQPTRVPHDVQEPVSHSPKDDDTDTDDDTGSSSESESESTESESESSESESDDSDDVRYRSAIPVENRDDDDEMLKKLIGKKRARWTHRDRFVKINVSRPKPKYTLEVQKGFKVNSDPIIGPDDYNEIWVPWNDEDEGIKKTAYPKTHKQFYLLQEELRKLDGISRSRHRDEMILHVENLTQNLKREGVDEDLIKRAEGFLLCKKLRSTRMRPASCKLSGVMAHPGYPGTGENGGERSNTYQYAAAAAHNPAISNALLLSEEDVVISPFAASAATLPATLSSVTELPGEGLLDGCGCGNLEPASVVTSAATLSSGIELPGEGLLDVEYEDLNFV